MKKLCVTIIGVAAMSAFASVDLSGSWRVKSVGTDPAERAFYRAFRDFNPLNDIGRAKGQSLLIQLH